MDKKYFKYQESKMGNLFWLINGILFTILFFLINIYVLPTENIKGIITIIIFDILIIITIYICILKIKGNKKYYFYIKNDVLILPFIVSYIYPTKIIFSELILKNIEILNDNSINEEFEKVLLFIKNNDPTSKKVKFLPTEFVFKNHYNKYYVLKYNYYEKIYYFFLIKYWFSDENDFLNSLIYYKSSIKINDN